MAMKLTLQQVEQNDTAIIYIFGEPSAYLFTKQKDIGDSIIFSRQIGKNIKSEPCLFKDRYEKAWVAFDSMPTPLEIQWEYVGMLRSKNG